MQQFTLKFLFSKIRTPNVNEISRKYILHLKIKHCFAKEKVEKMTGKNKGGKWSPIVGLEPTTLGLRVPCSTD